ncbi:TetR/AcrR family transcriptional regulator [Bacillus bombysepticus]|uniref:TetR/AcrR family transcriptional regulator n=1 Tax=Bacillus bombysepticus TaxID=658666 RepID=UPI00301677A5
MSKEQQILSVAAKVFSDYGYKATTMELIAKKTGIAKGTIYRFFNSKEALWNAIVLQVIADMKEAAEESFQSGLPFNQCVHDAIRKILSFRQHHKFTIKLYQEKNDRGTKAAENAIDQLDQAILSYIASKLDVAIRNKEIQPCNTNLTAFLVVKSYISLIFDWEKHQPPLSEEEILNIFDTHLFEKQHKEVAP